jgi:intracellular septation protein
LRRLGTLGVVAIPYLLLVGVGVLVTAVTRTEVLIKLDPTIRFWVVAAILGVPYIMRFNIFERLLSRLCPAPQEWWRTLLFAWLVVLVVLGAVNLLVAFTMDLATWVSVKLFGLTGLFWVAGIALVFMHYGRRPRDNAHVRA